MTSSEFDLRAWSWVAHLRAGGTTPWAEWASVPVDAPVSAPGDRLPGAAQMEVVRRLAARHAELDGRASGAGPDFARLADLVLSRSAPGRGQGEIPLADHGVGRPHAAIGTPAADPAEVPAGELVRVLVGTLAELLVSGPDPADPPRPPRRRPWATRFRLAGPPVRTATLRAALAAEGHVEGGRKPRVVVTAGQLDELLCDVWSARVQRGANLRWSKFVGRLAREDRLPVPADLPMIAAHWAERVGPARVHVVLPTQDDPAARRTAAEILDLPVPREDRPPGVGTDVLPVAPAGVDLLRRLTGVLNVRVDPERERALLGRAARHLTSHGDSLLVPERHAEWAHTRAVRMADELRAGRYAVHGDPERVVSRRPGQSHRSVREDDVLDLALDACLRVAGP